MPVEKALWNQRVLMRDGVEIAADVMLPKGDGPFPSVVIRTPYERGLAVVRPDGCLRLVGKGYALVNVDVRGRNDSEGKWRPWVNDSEDAYDVIEWVAAQSWSTGQVGMVGGSYVALTQWWAAAAHPPHLSCIVPLCVGVTRSKRGFGNTGLPSQYWLWWLAYVTGKIVQNPGSPCWEAQFTSLPLKSLDQRMGFEGSAWQQYVSGEIEFSAEPGTLSDEDFAAIDIPVLIGVGWWDDQTTMDTWMALQQAQSVKDCRLLIGAWDHIRNTRPPSVLGGIDVANSQMDTISYMEQFLAMHLKGESNDLSEAPRCKLFDLGSDHWEQLDDWPHPEAVATPIYLDSDGDARGLKGSGRLVACSRASKSSDTYIYDPNHPSRDMGNLDQFAFSDPPLDHRYLHRRDDVLVYDSVVLDKPLSLSGLVVLKAYLSSDRPDTDLFVGISDVHPDGRAIGLFATNEPKGGLRLRYRNGPDEELMTPGEIYEAEVPGVWLHHTFKTGHRLRITIHSNDFPFAARNAGTGKHWAEDTELLPQANTIHYGPEHPSHVVLPIVSGELN